MLMRFLLGGVTRPTTAAPPLPSPCIPNHRSASPHGEQGARLAGQGGVEWAEQQRELVRHKRDLGPSSPVRLPSDPLFKQQWHLNKVCVSVGRLYVCMLGVQGGRGGADMGVAAAWSAGLTGAGVVVTILDDGIQRDHPDLIRNYDPLASKDINGNDADPTPQVSVFHYNNMMMQLSVG